MSNAHVQKLLCSVVHVAPPPPPAGLRLPPPSWSVWTGSSLGGGGAEDHQVLVVPERLTDAPPASNLQTAHTRWDLRLGSATGISVFQQTTSGLGLAKHLLALIWEGKQTF